MFVAVGYIAYIEYERQKREEELFNRGKVDNEEQHAGGQNNKSHRYRQQRERRLRRKIRPGRRKEPKRKVNDNTPVDPFVCLSEFTVCGYRESEVSPETSGNVSYFPTIAKNMVTGETHDGNLDGNDDLSSTKKLVPDIDLGGLRSDCNQSNPTSPPQANSIKTDNDGATGSKFPLVCVL